MTSTGSCYLLAAFAHPDDAEYGIAGTAAKWIKEGKSVIYVVCTDGSRGTEDLDIDRNQLIALRENEQRAAAGIIGVSEVIFLRYEDQGLEDTSEFRKEIVRLIRTFKPEIVATSDPHQQYIAHRDHRIAGRVVMDAVLPYARDHLAYPDLLAQGLEPHRVKQVLLWGAKEPNYFSDISETFETKIAALRCHHSQVGHRPPEWEQRVKKRYQDLAKGLGFSAAEAFYRIEFMR